MGLFNSIFRRPAGPAGGRNDRGADTSDDEGDSELPENRAALRREAVQAVLRETMRAHGVPSDWLTVTLLPQPGGTGRAVHIVVVVRQAHEQMLAYVPAFQRSFLTGLGVSGSRAPHGVIGLSWQFEGMSDRVGATSLPPLAAAAMGAPLVAEAARHSPEAQADDELQEDLRALFAIRDEALQAPDSAPPESEFQPTQPLE
jgi:hypothetical protein